MACISRTKLLTLIVAVCLSILFTHPAIAQVGRLSAQVEMLSYQTRSRTLIPVEWTLTWSGSGILEGTLESAVYRNNTLVGTFRSEELALSPGERRFRTFLTPADEGGSDTQLTLRSKFIAKDKTFDLNNGIVRVPERWQRSFVICTCQPSGGGRANLELAQTLRFEQFRPPDQFGGSRNNRAMISIYDTVSPENLPTSALGYCQFDLVVIPPGGLSELRARQLKAVSEWVNAGGSMLVVPDGTLEPYHVEFLNKMASRSFDTPLVLNDAGTLENQPAARDIRRVRKGLGRVALVFGPPLDDTDYTSSTWRQTVWFLWKMQSEFLQPIRQSGRWQTANAEKRWGDARFFGDEEQEIAESSPVDFEPESVQPQPLSSMDFLLTNLMPDTVNVVPLWVLGIILMIYVLIVGPVDYFVLGWLKRRKVTWLLFPVVTLGFAAFTLWLSHHSMQTDDRRRSLVIVDVGDEGEIVRSSQIDLIFNGAEQAVETDIRHGFFAAIDNQSAQGSLIASQYAGRVAGESEYTNSNLVGPASFKGSIPTRYVVTQQVPQWTPQMNRTFHIAPQDDRVEFDWNSISPTDAFTHTNSSWLIKNVTSAIGPDVSIFVAHDSAFIQLSGPQMGLGFDVRDVRNDYNQRSFLHEICAQPQAGLFTLVSQTSPTGDGGLEDLALLDSTDPKQWMLILAFRRDDKLMVYRKLYKDSR